MKGPVSTSAALGIPVYQKILEVAQGGFTLDDSVFANGDIIPIGTVIGYDESTRKAKVAKMGVLQANATNSATSYQVHKRHNLAVGMSIILAGGTARAITAIDTSNASYDAVSVGTTIGVAGTAGDAIYVSDIGVTAPKGTLLEELVVDTNATLSVVIRGTLYHRRIKQVPASVQAKLPNLIFSESY